ncbi:MAG: class I SAM-dependent methyltransferase [Deltaproteobacteria bacterium]|nr:class I SAM-dependent methyltransferase [Deltaproteobacteria bacterium]
MRRCQLFEFEDLPWFPDPVRAAIVELLGAAHRRTGLGAALVPSFLRVLEASGCRSVLDLCSGAGGPVTLLLEALQAEGRPLPRVLLSDLYPRLEPWTMLKQRWGAQLDFVPRPVDATALPGELLDGPDGKLVTVVSALHHFPEEMVRALLGELAVHGAAIYVAECFPRSLLRASAYLPALLSELAVGSQQLRRAGPLRALLYHPLALLGGLWDYFASILRIHEGEELLQLARRIAPHYSWGHGLAPFPPWGRALYFWGIPPAAPR